LQRLVLRTRGQRAVAEIHGGTPEIWERLRAEQVQVEALRKKRGSAHLLKRADMGKFLPTILDTKHENILAQERALAKTAGFPR